VILKFRHISFSGMIHVVGGGTLIFDDCDFENFSGIPLEIEPTAPFNLVMTNSRISNNTAAGVLIKPASGGSVTATFDVVTITNNAGGLHTDTTNRSASIFLIALSATMPITE
jgi:hypothetical protein